MTVWIVWITGTEIIGHVFPEQPDVVHYVADNMKHEQQVSPSSYDVIEEVVISKEEV